MDGAPLRRLSSYSQLLLEDLEGRLEEVEGLRPAGGQGDHCVREYHHRTQGQNPEQVRVGPGRVITTSLGVSALATTSLAGWTVLPGLIAARFVGALTLQIASIHTVTVRQSFSPDEMQGRVAATARVVVRMGAPLGSVLGAGPQPASAARLTKRGTKVHG